MKNFIFSKTFEIMFIVLYFLIVTLMALMIV